MLRLHVIRLQEKFRGIFAETERYFCEVWRQIEGEIKNNNERGKDTKLEREI